MEPSIIIGIIGCRQGSCVNRDKPGEVADQVWQVSFMAYDLGFFDQERDRVEPGPSPFDPNKVLTMCPE